MTLLDETTRAAVLFRKQCTVYTLLLTNYDPTFIIWESIYNVFSIKLKKGLRILIYKIFHWAPASTIIIYRTVSEICSLTRRDPESIIEFQWGNCVREEKW